MDCSGSLNQIVPVVWILVWAIVWAVGGGLLGAVGGAIWGPVNAAIAATILTSIGSVTSAALFWVVCWLLPEAIVPLQANLPHFESIGAVIVAIMGGALSNSLFSARLQIPNVIFWSVYGTGLGGIVGSIGSLIGLPVASITPEVLMTAIAAGSGYAGYGAGIGVIGGLLNTLLASQLSFFFQPSSGSISGALWSGALGAVLGTIVGAMIGAAIGFIFVPGVATAIALCTVMLVSSVLWMLSWSYK
ncbi:hypothetical protein [Trichocoleus sp. FACHB-262]|uniref:hypothetical protein n=1 Tax=Trichocoleus sp. FACHB-262 TaxID=2692869 RepID=UPI001682C860|nr:hypothetical protein [Trichocoleus sp. FACHB-262]MBD2122761.1 hypothetical protein [Trichocoleus sp. FACHB-262]